MGTRYQQAVDTYLQSLLAAGRSRQTLSGSRSALSLLSRFAKSDKLQSVAASVPAFLSQEYEDLSHNSADRLRRQGVTVDEIASILGHANLATTMIYLRGNQQERGLAAHRRHNPADALLGGDEGNVIPFRPR